MMKHLWLKFCLTGLLIIGWGGASAFSADLSCTYLDDIQEKFLDLHINFSSLDRKKVYFRSRMFGLQRRTQDQFIKALDMDKLYLTRADIRTIRRLMKNIFTQIKEENCSALDRIYKLYYDRVSERVQFAEKYLKNSQFSIDTTARMVLDSKRRKRPSSSKALNALQTTYIQYQMANAIIASSQDEYAEQLKEARRNVLHAYDRLHKRVKSWAVNLSDEEKKRCYNRKKSTGTVAICKPDQWYSIYLSSFARALDPHSSYLSKEAQEDFEINMRLSLDGIGASLSARYGQTMIERLIPGGAAARSGRLKPKDKILAVGQTKWKMVNIFDMSLRDIVTMIRGKRGTPVYLRILRTDKHKGKKKKRIFTVRLIRNRVQLKDQAAGLFYFDRKVKGKKYTIGVLSVPSFYGDGRVGGRSVSKDIKKLLRKARRKVSALVLDLSNNGGGSLLEAIRTTGLFFADGGVVRQLIKTKDGDRYLTLSDVDKRVEYSGPLVVLINRVSASASEIVSGTLKSYRRAVIVGGDHTFGKGSVQSVERLNLNLGSVRVTVGLFFIPNGFSTQLHGVASDISFPSVLSNDEIGEKNLDYVLPKKKIPGFLSQSAYVFEGRGEWRLVSSPLISFLNQQSQSRIKQSKKFAEIREDIKEITLKKQKGYAVTIAELFSTARKEDEKPADPLEKAVKNPVALRQKRYKARADVQEAVSIAADFTYWNRHLKLARKEKPLSLE